MCGIVGLFNLSPDRRADRDRAIITGMADCISHRGPDHKGIWQDTYIPLTIGHQRLSILDLSSQGHQPMTSRRGDMSLAITAKFTTIKIFRMSSSNPASA